MYILHVHVLDYLYMYMHVHVPGYKRVVSLYCTLTIYVSTNVKLYMYMGYI